MNLQVDLVVIGAGPAGLAAAVEAYDNGCTSVLVLERDMEAGGILNQCIHNGFGLHYFKEELTGPEYAGRFVQQAAQRSIAIKTDTMVLDITRDDARSRLSIQAVNPSDGYLLIDARAIILAMGCRERTRGAIGIPGMRPAGVFTAGSAQRLINIEGGMVGRRVVILGSGDIGLIMARRLTLEGAQVLACVELMPYSGGLQRNITQCLEDFDIPLYLSHTITEIRGEQRVEQVVISKTDEKHRPIPGTEWVVDCDTLLLSVGLIPENELSMHAGIAIDPRTKGPIVDESMQTSLPGVFACGNVVHVHDLVDFVTMESQKAGRAAARYLSQPLPAEDRQAIPVTNGANVTYTVPQRLHPDQIGKSFELFFRVCRVLPKAIVTVSRGETVLLQRKREHMAPGEMERLIVPTAKLDQSSGDITVRAEEVDA